MNFIPQYIERKRNPALVEYLDPRMESILDRSLGLIVYQDDVLYIALQLAGYNWGEVDKFRKAIGKKIASEMAAQKDKFFTQIIEGGMAPDKVEILWDQIETFAGYGFNKAHAASYGYVAYVTAYLKANYPAEFMCAVLTAESGDAEKVAQAIAECERIGIKVLPPSINASGLSFQVDGSNVRFGLIAIKNVGEGPIRAIEEARADGGPFTSLDDLVFRVKGRNINKRVLESLIKAGAMDELGSRAALLLVLDEVLEKLSRSKQQANQSSLFESLEDHDDKVAATPLPSIDEASTAERAAWEKELMGLYITTDPMKEVRQSLVGKVTHTLDQITNEVVGQQVQVGGMITKMRKIFTKASNAEMAFVAISDGTAEVELVVFPKAYEVCKGCLIDEAVVVATGRVDNKDDRGLKVLVDKVKLSAGIKAGSVEQAETPAAAEILIDDNLDPLIPVGPVAKRQEKLIITVPKSGRAELLQGLKRIVEAHPGQTPILLVLPNGASGPKSMLLPMKVDESDGLARDLQELFGLPPDALNPMMVPTSVAISPTTH